MIVAAVAAMLVHRSFAATPEGAAIGALGFESSKPAVVERVNRVGRYAVLLIANGRMENAPFHSPILVERFSFGWQPLEALDFVCRLAGPDVDLRAQAPLMRGMPPVTVERTCGFDFDRGSAAEVAEVRQLMTGPLVPSVSVYGDWALGSWYGAGGGEDLWHRLAGVWSLATGGGGVIGIAEMREYRVPRSAWCALGVYSVSCPPPGKARRPESR